MALNVNFTNFRLIFQRCNNNFRAYQKENLQSYATGMYTRSHHRNVQAINKMKGGNRKWFF